MKCRIDDRMECDVDVSYDFLSCPGFDAVEHHHGFCWEGGVCMSECLTCPGHTFHAYCLQEIIEGKIQPWYNSLYTRRQTAQE